MAYEQKHKYGYRDALQKGDSEKVIKGEYFDDEFEAIEEAISSVPGVGGDAVEPDAPGFEDVVFQNRTEDQQVVSKFTFAVDGQEPLTVENTGIWAGVNYVKYVSADTTWKVLPGLEVEGDLSVSGNTHLEGTLEVDGSTQLNADLNVDGNIDATGGISLDGDLAIGGQIEGDLTVNGNITIDGGGSIIYPDGTTGVNEAPKDGEIYARQNASWVELPDEADPYDDTWIQPALDLKAAAVHSHTYDSLTGKPTLYTGADAVKTSGNQTIGGAKTFSSNVTAPDFVATSDERAKDNITTAPVGLIDSIRGREWDWKESGEKGSGVVAQELEQVLPHLVKTDDEGMKSVAYNGLLAYLIEELKDCRQRLAVLEAHNEN